MKKVVVTGADGQLGNSLQKLSEDYKNLNFRFLNRKTLDITSKANVDSYIAGQLPDLIVNTAAYTQVDIAEKEKADAYDVNVIGVENLLSVCEKYSIRFIQLSTDYVFDGKEKTPKKEDDKCTPVNFYGKTKYEAEQLVVQSKVSSVILRTSWLFSEFGNNFVKTILRLVLEKDQLKVVDDQWGSPTYTDDLARCILWFLENFPQKNEIYHFANQGCCSWYEFAQRIVNLSNSHCELQPIPTTEYPTLAKRPKYSVLDTHKIQETRGIIIRNWQDSLEECMKNMNK
ncbi:dTDP-4-dehydrorhamnose reductase [Balneicella halophila]|uniref:dTDP-4-dehydrorhamnose reductase n=1 Tax=Balneicella halophila TaxID=1537566 RepID=A0A7L4UR36_BALHA|nr:dTDP-4-dehydrorhamnose reductase [Balneicella halophila]PVX50759.1 dTDP-4-dehydrorhamnose reductase [Balneicella halophila]